MCSFAAGQATGSDRFTTWKVKGSRVTKVSVEIDVQLFFHVDVL